MVQLDDPLSLAADVISRFSLMSIIPEREVKMKEPFSDPTSLSSKQRQVLLKRVDLSVKITTPDARPGEAGKRKEPLRGRTQGTSEYPANLRLSYPVERCVERQLPRSYDVDRSPALSRPLTPILRVHCTRHFSKPVPATPVKVDYLKKLPVDITILLLQKYISPPDLLSVRGVCKYYQMLCDLKVVKRRWKEHLTVEKLNFINRGKENSKVTPLPLTRRMSRSKGPLSPIQPAPSASSPAFRWGDSPKTPVQHTPSSLARQLPQSPDLRPKPRTICRRTNPPPSPLASRSTRQSAALRATPQASALRVTPQAAPTPISRPPPPRHPHKRAPSARDIKSDDLLPTPEKITPSKRSVDGKKKRGDVSRTPFRTLNMGTPNSNSSSKTSLSSTTSLVTPDFRTEHAHITPEFKVPSYSINSKSRQRLKRL